MENQKELEPLAPRPNLDFSKGVRAKYFDRMQQGTNIVLIAPDLLDTFPDSDSVNKSLRPHPAQILSPAEHRPHPPAAS